MAGGFLNDRLDVNVNTQPIHCFFPCNPFEPPASGNVTFTDDYVFTVTGGFGQAFFEPCMFAETVVVGSQANFTSASFGGLTLSNGNHLCSSPGLRPIGSFIFGVPQTDTVSLVVEGGMGYAHAGLYGFDFFDASGNQLTTNVRFTLISVDLPEPSSRSFLTMGLTLFLAMRFGTLLGRYRKPRHGQPSGIAENGQGGRAGLSKQAGRCAAPGCHVSTARAGLSFAGGFPYL
jgi:hypothetical protein